MIGQHLLRLVYRRPPPRKDFIYGDAAKELSMEEGDIVDIGGGPGYISMYLPRKVYYVVQDIDYKLLSYGAEYVDKVLAPAEERVFREKSFDVVLMHDALHHFTNPLASLRNAVTMCRGRLVIFEFNVDGLLGKIIKVFEKIVGFPGNFYKPDELSMMVVEAGCPHTNYRVLDRLRYLVKCTPTTHK